MGSENYKKILEWVKLIAETISAIAPLFKVIALMAGVFVVTTFVNDLQYKSEIETYVTQYEQYRDRAQVALNTVDELQDLVNESQARADDAVAQANSYQSEINRLRFTLRAPASPRPAASPPQIPNNLQETIYSLETIIDAQQHEIVVQDSIINLQDKQINSLRFALTEKDVQLTTLTQGIDSLRTIVLDLPEAPNNPDKLFGVIPMPSRSTSFAAGVAITAIAIGVILN